MDRKFVARLERAIECGEEHAPASTSARERL
jgi:hypothetical protein